MDDNTELLNNVSEINNRKATFIIIIFVLIFLLIVLILYLGYLSGNKNNNCYNSLEKMIGKYEIDNAIVDENTNKISCENCVLKTDKEKTTIGNYWFYNDFIIKDNVTNKLIPNNVFYKKKSN
jgi:hypothetical protein